MGKAIHDTSAAARNVFDRVSEAAATDVRAVCFEYDAETLRRTDNAQLALYTVGVATWYALEEAVRLQPSAMAGHSVGEYAAVVCAGMISIEDGARLVRRRGDLMARSGALRSGTMAAVLGLDDETVDKVCKEVRTGVVVSANYNCPGQVVISGDAEAVAEASQRLKGAGAKRCLPLNVSGAFHSPLMNEAAAAMGEALTDIRFQETGGPAVISNVTAAEAPATEWPGLLEEQLASPVRWRQSVQRMSALGVKLFIECGPGEVLSGLVKRIDTEADTMAINDREGLEAAAEALAGQSV